MVYFHRLCPAVVAEDMRGLSAGGGLLGLLGSAYFYPYALMQIYGLSKSQAGYILSMAAIGMIVGSPLLSYLSNNLFKARKPVLILTSALTCMISGALYFFIQSIPVVMLYPLCLGIGIFAGAVATIGFITNKELFPVSIAGTATGLVNFFPFLGGAIFQVKLGTVLDSQGLTASGGFAFRGFQVLFSGAFWVWNGSLDFQLFS